MGNQQVPLQLDERERWQVYHACHYADHYVQAGAPGHSQFLLIAKLSRMLDWARSNTPTKIQKVVYDEAVKAWRDVVTGVKVDMP